VTSQDHHSAMTNNYNFNPLEISFCGFSGSGKTTLIEKLARRWSDAGSHFGYIKHDAHNFDIDQPGKDTYRIAAAGAQVTTINDQERQAILSKGSKYCLAKPLLLECDFAVIEGYKDLSIPKIIMIDEAGAILAHFSDEPALPPLAYVGPWRVPPQLIAETLTAPYFSRDDVDAIANLVNDHFKITTALRPLYGLVLSGGRSRRMGQDKAMLKYWGDTTQLDHVAAMLHQHCDEVFVSARQDQIAANMDYAKHRCISDSILDSGPLGGILSAMRKHPNAAWFVAAIDLPYLNTRTIKNLISARDSSRFVSAYLSSDADYIEPLCAIYEPKCYPIFMSLLGLGLRCPVRILATIRIKTLCQSPVAGHLANINTYSDYALVANKRKPAHA